MIDHEESVAESDSGDVDYRDVFSEFAGKEPQIALKAYRAREGLTQTQLAKLTGIPVRRISAMENGRSPIMTDDAKRLAKVLKTNIGMFLTLRDAAVGQTDIKDVSK